MLKMKHQQGIPREQLQMLSFESMIDKDNPVRFVDSFVEHLDLSKLNFHKKKKDVLVLKASYF